MARPRSLALLGVVFAAMLVLAGCGDDETTEPTDGADDVTETTPADGDTGEDTGADTGDDAAPTADGSSLQFVAIDIDWEERQKQASAGELAIDLVNEGETRHTLVFEGREDDLFLEVAASDDTDEGTITLDPGEYTYYCDVPGHREAGMEGTLTVTSAD